MFQPLEGAFGNIFKINDFGRLNKRCEKSSAIKLKILIHSTCDIPIRSTILSSNHCFLRKIYSAAIIALILEPHADISITTFNQTFQI